VGFNKALFEPLVGKTFSVQLGDGHALELRLENIASKQASPRYETFVLQFTPPAGAPLLPDDSYPLATDGFGPEMIYISATHAGTPDPGAYYYESVFNVPV
jgi:hypothetical protein